MFLKADMTFIERNVKTHQNFMVLGRDEYVRFSLGRSVFRERMRLTDKFKFWKKPRQLAIAFEGANEAMEVNYKEPVINDDDDKQTREHKIGLKLADWNKNEAKKYINKQYAKQGAQKMLTGWQFVALFGVSLATLVFLILRFF